MMKKLLLIICFFFNVSLLGEELDLINIGDRFVEFGCDFDEPGVLIISSKKIDYLKNITKGIIYKPEIKISKQIQIDPNVWELFKYKKGSLINCKVVGLLPNTNYFLYLQTNSSLRLVQHFKSFEVGPIEATKVITYRKTDPGSIEFTWRSGKGSKRLVLVRKGDYPELPKNGQEYKSGSYGTDSARLGLTDTYVIFNGTYPKGGFIKLNNLPYDKFYFNIVEYNGEGKKSNYLPGQGLGNPSSNYPALMPPIASKKYIIDEDVAYIDWTDVDGALYYELIVSKDEKFTQIIEEYDNADVGNNSEFAIFIDDLNSSYFFMVRAVGERSSSDYSNIIEVSLE